MESWQPLKSLDPGSRVLSLGERGLTGLRQAGKGDVKIYQHYERRDCTGFHGRKTGLIRENVDE